MLFTCGVEGDGSTRLKLMYGGETTYTACMKRKDKVTAIPELQLIVYQLGRGADREAEARRGKESNKGKETE